MRNLWPLPRRYEYTQDISSAHSPPAESFVELYLFSVICIVKTNLLSKSEKNTELGIFFKLYTGFFFSLKNIALPPP